jgi:hypothetical protein
MNITVWTRVAADGEHMRSQKALVVQQDVSDEYVIMNVLNPPSFFTVNNTFPVHTEREWYC